MTAQPQLFLHQEVLLLMLREEDGSLAAGVFHRQVLAGAALSDLLLAGRIRASRSGRKAFVDVISSEPVGNPLLDAALERLETSKRPYSLGTWVRKLAGLTGIQHLAAAPLVEDGILCSVERSFLRFIRWKVYPEADPAPEREIRRRLEQAIFGDAEAVEARTVVLLSLIRGGRMLGKLFDRKRLKTRRERIERIVNGEATGAATGEAVQAAQTAMIVAAIIPATIAASTAAHH